MLFCLVQGYVAPVLVRMLSTLVVGRICDRMAGWRGRWRSTTAQCLSTVGPRLAEMFERMDATRESRGKAVVPECVGKNRLGCAMRAKKSRPGKSEEVLVTLKHDQDA